ncbi:hypothetical protein NA56DRAFT_154545 [Hyaloscypha hepaticicola]|uniref:Uncharacterized protein n=1 Tax=Hyaloscypha hepaticicola TaxID=2082293 RepID=A0A2J6QP48_9HELO|nr:hypothetical protein NA56DRAFT_154545 [Hyaloscypha hepaticicola]
MTNPNEPPQPPSNRPQPPPPSQDPQNTTSSPMLNTYIHHTTNLPDRIVRAEVGSKTVQDQVSKTLKAVARFEVEFAL